MGRPKSKRPHGTGSKQVRGKGGRRTRLRWYDEHGQRHSKTVDSDLADKSLAIRIGREAAAEAGTRPDARLVPTLKALAATWLAERTNRSAKDDRSRWKNHLEPELGHLRPREVTGAVVRRLIMKLLANGKRHERGKLVGKPTGEGLSPGTVGLCIKLLSVFFNYLIAVGEASVNPCAKGHLLPETRKRIKSDHDPETVEYLERPEDIRQVFLALPEPINIAFAIGVMAGLRPSEIRALPWAHVHLDHRRIHVQIQVPTKDNPTGKTKGGKSRMVPLEDDLWPILTAWKLRATGPRVIPSMRPKRRYLDVHTMGKEIRIVLERLGLMATPWEKPWYQSTRHTYASQQVLGGCPIERLQKFMGHTSITVTMRYAHLRLNNFTGEDRRRIKVDLSPATGKVLELGAGGTNLGPRANEEGGENES